MVEHSEVNARRWSLRERLDLDAEGEWRLSKRLFGDVGCDINDFLIENYVYFLDHVESRRDLVEGLLQLSPLADDALTVAEAMSEQDFRKFKRFVAKQRRGEEGRVPKKYLTLLIPRLWMHALTVAEECQAPLGAVLIRLLELERMGRFFSSAF